MNSYLEMRKRHQTEVNAFPIKWAFNNEQLVEGMRELGVNPEDTDKVVSIGGGGFMRCGLSYEDILTRPNLAVALKKAENEYLKNVRM